MSFNPVNPFGPVPTSGSPAQPVPIEWTGREPRRIRVAASDGLIGLGVLLTIVVSRWPHDPTVVAQVVLWTTIMFAALCSAAFVRPTTWSSRGPALATFTVAATLEIVGGTSTLDLLNGALVALADVIAFAGWLILSRRKPIAFALVIPAAGFAFLWYLNYAPGRWLQDLPAKIGILSNTQPFDYSAASLSWSFWYNLDLLVLGLLGALAALAGTQPFRTQQIGPPVPFYSPTAGYQQQASVPTYGSTTGSNQFLQTTNGLAVASLVFSILGACSLPPLLIVGIVCGHISTAQIRRTGEQGSGLATAGLIIGYVGIVVVTIAVAVLIAIWSNAYST